MNKSHLCVLSLVAASVGSLVVACSSDPDTGGGEDAGGGVNEAGVDGAKPVDAGKDSTAPQELTIGGQVRGMFVPTVGDGGAPDAGDASAADAGDASAGDAGAPKVLTLQNNGGDDLSPRPNAAFTFAKKVLGGSAYAVTVKSQPEGHTCAVAKGSGTATANVTDVDVACTRNEFSVKVDVQGLKRAGLVLQNNAANDLTVNTAGTSSFTTKVKWGDAYAVTVKTQPTARPLQTCTADAPSSGIVTQDTTVVVKCVDSFASAASYAADKTFASTGAGGTIIGLVWDGTSYYHGDCCGGTGGAAQVQLFDAAFAAGMIYPVNPGNLRGLFTKGAQIYIRRAGVNEVEKLSNTGVVSTGVVLATAPGNADANVAYDAVGDQIISQVSGTLSRWNFADGIAKTAVTLTGYGTGANEGDSPNNIWVSSAGGYALTIAASTLSVWDLTTGARVVSTQLTGVSATGGTFTGPSLSYANGRVWVRDTRSGAGNWLGYDVGL